MTDRAEAGQPGRLGRRAFLGSAALGAATLAAAGCTAADGPGSPGPGRRVPFLGRHQPGVDTPAARFGLLAAFNLVCEERGRLARTLGDLTDEARGLMEARPPERRDTAYPPAETGILGPELRTDGLSVTVSVGASVFDHRFGLAGRRPRELARMPFLANDRLHPAQTHGDLLLALSADQPDMLLHALRQLMRRTRDNLVLRWMLDGYNRPDARPVPGRTGNRNLLGFKDGAPLGLDHEHDDPGYGDDPAGHRIPLDAHIRMANPRTPGTAGSRILRRGFNFSRGFDAAGRLDQGLAFVSYQKSLARGFLAVQARLKGEPLEEYIRPVGGGFFFVLPGVTSDDGWLGQQLLA
jgi:deferrochelatase/peroxidase EfeB